WTRSAPPRRPRPGASAPQPGARRRTRSSGRRINPPTRSERLRTGADRTTTNAAEPRPRAPAPGNPREPVFAVRDGYRDGTTTDLTAVGSWALAVNACSTSSRPKWWVTNRSRSTFPDAAKLIAVGQVLAYRNTPVSSVSKFWTCDSGSGSASPPMPTRTTRPARPTVRSASAAAFGTPEHSSRTSGSRPASESGCSATLTVTASASSAARRSRCGFTSVIATSLAPKARAVCAVIRPTGPAPVISTLDPGDTRAFWHAQTPTDGGSISPAASSDSESGTG